MTHKQAFVSATVALGSVMSTSCHHAPPIVPAIPVVDAEQLHKQALINAMIHGDPHFPPARTPYDMAGYSLAPTTQKSR